MHESQDSHTTFGKLLDQNSELDQFDDFSMDEDTFDKTVFKADFVAPFNE